MSKSNIKCLITLNLFELTGDEIGELKQRQIVESHALKFLPEYCIRNDNEKIETTEQWLQFTESGDEKYFLFDILTIEEPLNHEIAHSGIDSVLDFDISFLKKLPSIKYEDMDRSLSVSQHVVFNLKYIDGGDGDYDIEITPHGYFNEEKELIKIQQ